jgi:KaiC/GvpD/RAD55 family RecA-like ATPase
MTGNPEVNFERVVEAINAAMKALGTRALLLIALIMAFSLFCWAMRLETILAFAIAAAFTALVMLPLLWVTWKKEIS